MILALFLFAAGGWLCYEGVLALRRRRRLVITAESIQLIDFNDRVSGQIPYDNVGEIRTIWDQVRIKLADLNEPNTWWIKQKMPPDIPKDPDEVIIVDSYPSELAEAIRHRIEARP